MLKYTAVVIRLLKTRKDTISYVRYETCAIDSVSRVLNSNFSLTNLSTVPILQTSEMELILLEMEIN